MHRYIAFDKVVQLGSFTKAAEELGYTQSAVSQMIASLEEELSIKLLYRSRTGVRLTPEGSQLYPFIQRTIYQYDAMKEKCGEIRSLDRATIRIGTYSSISRHWLPSLIRDFTELHPGVDFVLLQGDYTTIPRWVQDGELDFGFTTPEAVHGMKTTIVKSGEMVLVLPPEHPLSDRNSVSLKEVLEEPFLLQEQGAYNDTLEYFRRLNLSPGIRLRVRDDYSILSMVEEGLGISILPELVLWGLETTAHICHLDPPLYRQVSIVTKDSEAMPIASREFIDFMMERADELP